MNVGPIYFAEPGWSIGVWLWLALWLVVGVLERRGSDVLDRLVAPGLHAQLVERPARWRRWARYVLLGVAGLALVLATLRPQMGERFVATPRAGAEIMIAIDVSRSMLADDAAPSRLERAKAEVRDLLGYLRDDSVGLIAFAGRASLLSPMTPDLSFLRLALDGAGPHSVPRGGTRIGEAIRRAVIGFGEPGPSQRALILITDGEDHDDFAIDAAKRAAEAGIKIIAIGFGDEQGSPIFVRDPRSGAREQIRDANGSPVISKLNGELLRSLALETDGAFVPAGTGVLDLASIYSAHVAPLTRGEIDDQGRTLRNEAYQIFLIVGLICLLAGVQVTASGFLPSVRRAGKGGARLIGSGLLVLLVAVSAPVAVLAQSGPGPDPQAAPPSARIDPASSPDGERVNAERVDVPAAVTLRERFNEANRMLREGDASGAAARLREVRRDATDDLELRQAATWNLGVAAAVRAEAELGGNPEAALEALHEAADWLREAVALQPDEAGPRHDLEVVLRRALILADQVAQSEQGTIETALDQLIGEQRTRSLTCAGILEAVSGPDSDTALDRMRSSFDSEATEQRTLLTEVDELAERVVRERDAVMNMSPETRAPEETLRAAQLEGVLVHLDAAIERMGQSRRQLRQRRAERAYRRSAAALGDLKRARDQLRDPVEQIGVLLEEVIALGQASAALQMRELPPSPDVPAPSVPAFLSAESLEEEARRTQQRTAELGARLEQAAEQAAARPDGGVPSVGGEGEADPAARALADALMIAAPLVVEAGMGLEQAAVAIGSARWTPALEIESEVAEQLAAAREAFLDFDGLLDLMLADQLRIAGGAAGIDVTDLLERAPMLRALQEKNRARSPRLARQLESRREEALAALQAQAPGAAPGAGPTDGPKVDPVAREEERFTVAGQLLALAEGAMHESLDALDRLDGLARPEGVEGDEETPDGADLARASERARSHLEALKSLFFSLVEHLQKLAREQQDLNDETTRAITLSAADSANSADVADAADSADESLSSLAVDQAGLEERSGAIADVLLEQAEQVADPPPAVPDAEGTPGAMGAPDPATLRQAAEHVAAAQLSMREAGDQLTGDEQGRASVAASQTLALESLESAIALLAPPPPPQENDDSQSGDGEQGQDQGAPENSPSPGSDPAGSEGSEPEPPPSAPESGPGAPEEAETDSASDDASQLLQGVRDRESQRRRDLERERTSGRARPVEKDW
jgi:Ca-activated chloride channel family protein